MRRLKAVLLAIVIVMAVFIMSVLAFYNVFKKPLKSHEFSGGGHWHRRRFGGYAFSSGTEPRMPRLPPKGSERLIPCQKSVPFSPCTTSTNSSKPLIYFVTPTYPRREQAAELTRLAQTLLHIKDLHWVLAEDAKQCSNLIPSLMKRYPTLPFTYLASPIPEMYTRLPKKEIPRGVSSRRAALSLITDWHNKTACSNREAVVYFGDDDNTYDLRLFDEIRLTKKVSVFPVGLIGYAMSTPIVQNNKSRNPGRVVGFSDPWFEKRKFPVDMAGFAFSVDLLVSRGGNASMPYWVGHEEDEFIKSLGVEYQDLEPRANNCQEILVWHTKTVSEKSPNLVLRASQFPYSNLPSLIQSMAAQGVATSGQPAGFEVLTCDQPKGCDTKKPQRVVRG